MSKGSSKLVWRWVDLLYSCMKTIQESQAQKTILSLEALTLQMASKWNFVHKGKKKVHCLYQYQHVERLVNRSHIYINVYTHLWLLLSVQFLNFTLWINTSSRKSVNRIPVCKLSDTYGETLTFAAKGLTSVCLAKPILSLLQHIRRVEKGHSYRELFLWLFLCLLLKPQLALCCMVWRDEKWMASPVNTAISIWNDICRVCPRMVFTCLQIMAGMKARRMSVYESFFIIQSLACSWKPKALFNTSVDCVLLGGTE